MAAKSCICNVLVCLLALATAAPGPNVGTTFNVNWTLGWVQENYPERTPLEVELNDVLLFKCTTGLYANIYILSAPVCRCDESDVCHFLANCRGGNTTITSRIQTTSGTSSSLISYEPGTTYYFTSFVQSDDVTTIRATSGGECLEGFQLVVEVQDDSTPPPVDPVTSPPSSSEPSEPSQTSSPPGPRDTSSRPGVVANAPTPQGLGGAVSTTSSGSLTLMTVLLCTIIGTILRH